MPRFDDVGRLAIDKQGKEERVGIRTALRQREFRYPPCVRALVLGLSALLIPSAVCPAAADTSPSPNAGLPGQPSERPKSTDRATSPGSELTPQHIDKARRLILATGISRSFQIIIPEFMDQIGNTLTQSKPELVPDMTAVLTALRPEFDKQSDEMIDQSARIYAGLLSEKDIDAILIFFDSEPGKRYVGAQPFFLNQLVSGMQAWQQKISINMMARVREEMKKKGHDL